jgi:ParB family chromosome partitioning protein
MNLPALAKRIELWSVDRLKPYERNARTHDGAQVAKIAASITEFGFTNPTLVDSTDGIIAGHGRLMAAKELGPAEVPAIVPDHPTDAQRRAHIPADNRPALDAGWDNDMLAAELADLQGEGFDLELTGFTDAEIDKLLPTGEDAITEMPDLKSGDREPFRQMTFTLHDEQAESVERAMKKAKEIGPFVDSPNENGNGNALARICEIFLTQNGLPEGEYGDSKGY